MKKTKIGIVGAGPGSLTAAMILSNRGFDIDIFEKQGQVGGRNGSLKVKGYTFDIGPTFLMMKFILDEVFEEAGTESKKELDFIKLDPLYRLQFHDVALEPSGDVKKTREQIRKRFPGNEKGFDRFLKFEKKRFDMMYPCLQKHYGRFATFFEKEFISALPYLTLTKSMYQRLGSYFDDDRLKLCFTFQSKYLGMSPWECPAAFLIIPYIEHGFGVYHTTGGLSKISEAMARVAVKNGAKIHMNTPVKKIINDGRAAKGILLGSGRMIEYDEIIVGSDFGYSVANLIDAPLPRWNKNKLKKKSFSCSTFMLYLGLDKVYTMPFHQILFAKDYKANIESIFSEKRLFPEPSIYIRNASILDKTLAPRGHSALYILVPVPNNSSGIDWAKEAPAFRDMIINIIRKKTAAKDIEDHIIAEHRATPDYWQDELDVHLGATFNLGHGLDQMLYFRPHNRFEDLDRCYLTGGGTHPGSGLPTIYESGRITANLISRKYKKKYASKNLQAR